MLPVATKSTGSSIPALVTPRKRLLLTQDLVGSSPVHVSLSFHYRSQESPWGQGWNPHGGASSRKAIWTLGPRRLAFAASGCLSFKLQLYPGLAISIPTLSPTFVADSVEGTTCVTALSSKTTLQTDVIVSLSRWETEIQSNRLPCPTPPVGKWQSQERALAG